MGWAEVTLLYKSWSGKGMADVTSRYSVSFSSVVTLFGPITPFSMIRGSDDPAIVLHSTGTEYRGQD
jgi:hypothetical protein